MGNKRGMIVGLMFILLGGFFLATNLMPDLFGEFSYPYIVIGIGAVFLLAALLTGEGGLAVPACVVGGIGGILYYQEVFQDYASWSYLWTLIPGFVGVGVLLSGLLSRHHPRFESGGLVLIAMSAFGFFIFGGTLGGLNFAVGTYWPVFLIGIGFLTLISAIFRKR